MCVWMEPYPADYSSLGFDVENHREAFRAFANLGMGARSVPAALIAREAVVSQFPSDAFRITASAGPLTDEGGEMAGEQTGVVPLYESDDAEEVDQVRADVCRYFCRHFPGRCLNRAGGEAPDLTQGAALYAVFSKRPPG